MKGIRQVVEIYQANPTGKLLVAGHTDTDGDEGFNLGLSLDRAEAVKAYLKDDVAA
jgi:outer membrane protein OmpA-like peptidoglycan-associated protein